ncbi:MAG: hypothetical protein BM565_11460 [Gammaproteobacteria bacterium MedPE]|nr:MAG: hypothetical protein BM565_11460 [Gammaproteobacteria bacterium MedPE]
MILIAVGVIFIVLGLLAREFLVEPKSSAQAIQSAVIDKGDYRLFSPAKTVNSFVLNTNEGSFSNQDLMNKWTFVIFGYTYCPDVCPTTLTRVKSVLSSLQETANVQVAFVSADPLRDTPQRLHQYVNYFDSSFLGLTTSHDKLFPFAQNLYLPYGIVAVQKSEDYAVNHSASIALINPQGKYIAQFKPQHIAGEVPTVDMKQMALSFKNIVSL